MTDGDFSATGLFYDQLFQQAPPPFSDPVSISISEPVSQGIQRGVDASKRNGDQSQL